MNNSPFQPLHPTLKKCSCGLICTRTQLYKHLNKQQEIYNELGLTTFFADHGEVPLKQDDALLSI